MPKYVRIPRCEKASRRACAWGYLLDSYDVLQFPVIPLQKMPTLKNIFHSMTIGTYADEFAENHYRTMGAREAMSALVPSAGTGFVVSHRILDSLGDEPLLPEDSLTEDYKLSLILAKKGFNTHFVLEKVPRLMDNHTVRWDFIATRSFFPDTFNAAVRQKTRWIYGITMQSAKASEIFKASRMGFAGRYSLYKDLKAKLSNIMVLPGYLVFLYYVASLFFSLPYMYPRGTLAYGLCVFLTLTMVFRQFMRAVAITNFYGFKSMAVACLLPPLMPIRLIWGNIINLTATISLALDRERGIAAERIIVAAILLLSAAIRIFTIAKLPIVPSSDYQTYYKIAEQLAKGGLNGSEYSGYIAEFPHVIGYPFILSLLFRITGPSPQAGLYLNMAASLFGAFLTYRIARSLSGRFAGMIALFLAAFWPSQILYGAILGSEAVFTCLLLICLRLFLYLYRYPVTLGNRENSMFLCVALGVIIALTNAVRPLAVILLIAAVRMIVAFKVRFSKNEKMLNGKLSRASCQGWFLALVISLSFVLSNQLISASISNAIAYQLPGAAESFGFNLMVGVNIDAKGAWNQQDADFLVDAFVATDSAKAAHQAGRDVALARIGSDPLGVLNLAMEKFTMLWGNDDYARTWTTLFLGQQNSMTPQRQGMIDRFTQFNGIFYLFSVFFSAVFGLSMFHRRNTQPGQALILLFIGTVALHMFLEARTAIIILFCPSSRSLPRWGLRTSIAALYAAGA